MRRAILIVARDILLGIVILAAFLAIAYVGFEPRQRAEEKRFEHHHIYR